MISIVATYHNRREQAVATLHSIEKQIQDGYGEGLEFICVNHNSRPDQTLDDLTTQFDFLKIINVQNNTKNPCVPYNIGFHHSKGDKVIIQNAECLHAGNILEVTDRLLTENNYLSFACYSTDQPTAGFVIDKMSVSDINGIVNTIQQCPQARDGFLSNCWYNHSIHSPRHLHFTTAISKKALNELRGFDERYEFGMDYDDNEFIFRIKKMGLQIVPIDSPFSVHLFHESSYVPTIINSVAYTPNDLRRINFNIFVNKTQVESGHSAIWNQYY